MEEFDVTNLNDLSNAIQTIKGWFQTNGFRPAVITARLVKDRVSRQQQRYLFGVVYPMLQKQLEEMGYEEFRSLDQDEMHNSMKTLFFYKVIRTKNGSQKVPKTLKLGKANKDDVCRYIDDLLAFGSKIGVYIPSPGDDWYESNVKQVAIAA